jgi:DNA-binding PadR family transcriptional regulator
MREPHPSGANRPSPFNRPPSPSRVSPSPVGGSEERLEGLLNRIQRLASGEPPKMVEQLEPESPQDKPTESSDNVFFPQEPQRLQDTGITETQIEELILKFLLARGDAQGRQIANQVKLPFILIDGILRRLKQEQLVVYRDAAQVNDYQYQLTESGRERARRFAFDCSYYGATPVTLVDYIESVKAQSLTKQRPSEQDLRRAFSDLLINQRMFMRLGPAINSGRGMFLYGYPGNGKTSIAERVTRCFGDMIWIPRAIGVDGEIIRVFDPNYHEEVPLESASGLLSNVKFDSRWIRIKRPTIIVGGELTMEQLELRLNTATRINEAPIQLKSNCGTLVIDDFGRQRMRTDELLNRWIVPLEKRHDYLNLPSGKSIRVPFDQLVIFSTNLEPKDLVDDAFLRRIPYKIEVEDPTEQEFIELFRIMSPIMGLPFDNECIRYLIDTHYKPINRPFRCCQPRDLLLQVKNLCMYCGSEPKITRQYLDFAVENYFAVM